MRSIRYALIRLISLLIACAVLSLIADAQGSNSSLSGVVADPNGGVIAGASVTVKNLATGEESKSVTASNGTFTVPVLAAGTYTVIVSAAGFKQAVVNDVKLDAGVPGTVKIPLEIGAATETVTIQGGGEVVQTQSATIAQTLQVTQIASLPLVSRNPLNFVVLLPGVSTASTNRNSTVNGLPTSAIDITLDGINIQDNFNKSTDGFFTRVAPSLDSVQEVTVSTATPEASGGAQGAVSIKFVTRSGTNEFHGGLYEYHRNPWLNSAYWFNNRDVAPINKATGKTCVSTVSTPATQELYNPDNCHATRDRVLFNQYGGRFGGPVTIPKLFDGRNKAFFFVNFEASNQPSQVSRQRTIMSPLTQSGTFQYNFTSNNVTTVRTVNLLTLAATNGQTATIDPVIGKLLSDIRSATSGAGGITQLTDPNLQRFSYNPTGSSTAKRPTVRFDFNVTEKHHAEATWSYLDGRGGPDFLNSVEPRFPGFPNQGSQPADRYTGSAALRSTLKPTLVNEFRAGLSGGPSRFNPTASKADFTGSVANQAGFNLNISAFSSGGTTNALTTATATSAPSRRNPLYRDISDTVNWTRGAHSYTFGGKYTWVTLTFNQQTLVPTINFGVDSSDPANAMFTTTNFQGASSTDLTNARNLYAVLTGRVTAINANVRLDEKTGKYVYLGTAFERARQKEAGFFAQESWRFRPNLTLNYGLRWEIDGAFVPLNNSYSTLSLNDLWGVSGVGNLFKPGTQTGKAPQFTQLKAGTSGYEPSYKNFAPNFGFAWSPNAKSGFLKRLIGDNGQTVLRGGYSIAYSRRGIGEIRGILTANPGATLTTNRDLATGNLVGGSLGSLPLLLRETSRLGPPAFNDTPTYPFTAPITSSGNLFDPKLRLPYTQSWTFGIQREINKDTAIEVRYVGNKFLHSWTTYDLNDNDNNILENGLFSEFKKAQANLQANIAAGRGNTFAYTGVAGTSALPITLAYFSGIPASQANDTTKYTSSNFTSTTFTNNLALFNPAPITYASNLSSDAGRRANAIAAGLAANFILTNPDLRGGATFTGNGGYTTYNGLQVELRRRLSKGLLVQANYVFGKSFSSSRIDYRVPRVNSLNTGTSSTVPHAFKVNWIYELPFGKGKMLFGQAGGLMDRLIGGWEFDGTGRVQSGRLFDFGNVRLVGMTRKDLQQAFGLYFDDANKVIYSLPKEIIDNTIKAFSVSATSTTGYGSLGPPTGRYIAPANSDLKCIQVFGSECAPTQVAVTGPKFTRFDLSLVKRVKITERFNFELRAEMLNAFNHINFIGVTCASSSATCGQVTSAYTDPSNTQDPGGRLGQIVLRLNF